MTSNDVLIVIGRQYGSGGRALGRELSRRLSIPFYDRELLSEAARQFGISLPAFEREDERRPSLLRTVVESAFGSSSANISVEGYTPHHLYSMQSKVIEQIAELGGAIFVGRTADYVLRDNPRLLSVFVHSDDATRARRLIKRGECTTKEQALDMARRHDRLRQGYYNYYTGRQWGHAANYHLSVDMGKLGISAAADVIMQGAYAMSRKP